MAKVDRGKFVSAAAVALLVVTAAYLSMLVAERQRLMAEASRYNLTWSISQAVNELSRFEREVAEAAVPNGDRGTDEVQLRYEILLNRLRLLSDGEAAAFTARAAERQGVVAELSAALAEVQHSVAIVDQPGVARQVLARLWQLDTRMAHLAAAANRESGETVARNEHELMRLHEVFSALCFAVIVGGIVLVAAIFCKDRLLRRATAGLRGLTEELRRSGDILDCIPAGLLVVGANGRIAKVNRAACELTGYRADELIDASVAELISPALRDAGALGCVADEHQVARDVVIARDGRRLPITISRGVMMRAAAGSVFLLGERRAQEYQGRVAAG